VGYQIAAFVGHRNIHGLTDLFGLHFRRPNYAARVFQFHCRHASPPKQLCCPAGNGTNVVEADETVAACGANRKRFSPDRVQTPEPRPVSLGRED
jgi:hypothetical protein